MFELSKIAAMAGQGGLFSIHTGLRNGVVLESLDEKKTKLVAGATSKVSVLSEISIYTTVGEGSVSLESVLQALYKKHKGVSSITSKSDGSELRQFLIEVLPTTDFDRVYMSDIKKLANWYNLLVQYAPEVLVAKEAETEKPEKKAKEAASPKKSTETSETIEEKPKAKKAPVKKKKEE